MLQIMIRFPFIQPCVAEIVHIHFLFFKTNVSFPRSISKFIFITHSIHDNVSYACMYLTDSCPKDGHKYQESYHFWNIVLHSYDTLSGDGAHHFSHMCEHRINVETYGQKKGRIKFKQRFVLSGMFSDRK